MACNFIWTLCDCSGGELEFQFLNFDMIFFEKLTLALIPMLAYKRNPLLKLSLSIDSNRFPEVTMSKWRNSRRYVLGPSLHSAYISNVRTGTRPHSWARPGLLIHPRSGWQLAEKLGMELGDSLWCWCLGIVWCHDSCSDNQQQIPDTASHSWEAARFWVDGGWMYHIVCNYTPKSSIHNIRLSWRLFCQFWNV